MYKKYFFRPIQHGLTTEFTPLNQPFTLSSWGTKNMRIFESSAKKRWGYNTEDRDVGVAVHNIVLYQTTGGTRHTLYLTGTNLCVKKTSTSETWAYGTEAYTTGTVTNIQNNTPGAGQCTITGNGTTWTAAMVGDEFILNLAADYTANAEPNTKWATIASRSGNTSIVLDQNYGGTTGAMSNNYIIRRIYSTPTNERWSWAVVNDIFVFTNGNTNVQQWSGAYASDLETGATTATKARYCIEYANRLFILDYKTSRNPLALGWSKEGDPTNWTDSTSGELEMLDSAGYGMGLGKSGTGLVVFQEDLINFYSRTGIATSPIVRTNQKMGIGCSAPYGIIQVRGSCVFMGREDFYVLDGDYPQPIGAKIRDKFFSIVGRTERKKVFGWHIPELNEAIWVANTDDGKLAFCWDYKRDEWNVHSFNADIVSIGVGAT